jgi:hypothetical protein
MSRVRTPTSLPRLAAAPLLAAALLALPGPAPAQEAAESLPPAAELLDRHVEATGGKEAHLAHRSRRRKGELTIDFAGHHVVAGFEEQMLAPDKCHLVYQGESFFQVQVSCGGHAWEWRPGHEHEGAGTTTLLEGLARERALEKARLDGDVTWRERFEEVETVGRAEVAGRPTWEVRVKTRGGETFSQFYDVETGRLARKDRSTPGHGGEVLKLEIYPEEYREFDGVWLPTRVRALTDSERWGKGTQVFVYSEVEHDVEIAESLFELPEELREPVAEKAK